MNNLINLLQPILGALTGILLIVFSTQVALFLQKVLEKFPKYDKNIFKDLSVRPIYIKIIGVIYIFVAINGLIAKLSNV